VASLALLRRLGGPGVDRLAILQESLLDSFKELSSHQESYV
jgi:hypothetical protein